MQTPIADVHFCEVCRKRLLTPQMIYRVCSGACGRERVRRNNMPEAKKFRFLVSTRKRMGLSFECVKCHKLVEAGQKYVIKSRHHRLYHEECFNRLYI